VAGSKKHPIKWQEPVGNTKENPAMKDNYSALTWKRRND
jgi:hypothetical protein